MLPKYRKTITRLWLNLSLAKILFSHVFSFPLMSDEQNKSEKKNKISWLLKSELPLPFSWLWLFFLLPKYYILIFCKICVFFSQKNVIFPSLNLVGTWNIEYSFSFCKQYAIISIILTNWYIVSGLFHCICFAFHYLYPLCEQTIS